MGNAGLSDSIKTCMAMNPRDWSLDHRDAWLWGVVFGWDDIEEVALKHNWDTETVERLNLLHKEFQEIQ